MSHLPHDKTTELGRRIDVLETFALRALAWVTAATLVAGLLLPYLPASETAPEPEGEETGDQIDSLLTAGFQAFAWRNVDGEPGGGEMVAMGVGFLGLLAVVLFSLVLLYLIGTRDAGMWTAGLLRTCAVLATIGTVVAGLLLWIAKAGEDADDYDAGWGLAVLALGVVLLWTFLTEDVRRWWDDPR